LHKKYPYQITSDLIEKSNKDLANISRDLELTKASLSDIVRDYLAVIIRMIDSKIELVKEQNDLINNLYTIFTNLEPEIRKKEYEFNKDISNTSLHKDSKNKHIEYVYKDIIIKYLKEVYRTDEAPDDILNQDEKERLLNDKINYINEKQLNVQKLEKRNIFIPDTDIDYSNIVSFNYEKKEDENKGMFSFFGNIFK